ncbi:hypothetical protein, partial [Parabacteroides distasonis]|uniref:hypothetical protein n=1 Tax=Parabacteroides distasonis TaxID=823 RepID=UPI001E2F5ECE
QGFRVEYAPQEEDSARNGSAARPCRCHQAIRYLCIRATRERVAGGMNLNYTIGCYHCHKKQTM